MDFEIFQHHLNLTSLVIELAVVLDSLFYESAGQTVGHILWHGLTASGAVTDMFLASAADDVSGSAAGDGKLPRNDQAHGALEIGLQTFNLFLYGLDAFG